MKKILKKSRGPMPTKLEKLGLAETQVYKCSCGGRTRALNGTYPLCDYCGAVGAKMTDKDKLIAELEAEVERLTYNAESHWIQREYILKKERDQLRELCREMRDSLTSAKGWVVTYAMQTHSRMASSEAEKINVLLEKADAILGADNE